MSRPITRPPTRWPVAVVLGLLASLIVATVVLAFTWPTKTSTAQDLPVSIAGPGASVTAVQGALSATGLFDFHTATDRDAALTQIQTRQTYGAIVLGAPGTAPEVLTAPAAGSAATQLLTSVATQLEAQSQTTVTVTPVVSLADSDATGAGLTAASFPLTLGGMLGGVAISLLVVGALRRLAALAGFAVLAGLALTLVLQAWFGFLQGNFLLNASATGLSVLATASLLAGCASLLGTPGIGIGAVLTLFAGNPLSAATAPWQFLPEPWGVIGQYFVPGATNTLIRSLSYFPDAPTVQQWLTLSAWAAAGLVLVLVGHARTRVGSPSTATEVVPA